MSINDKYIFKIGNTIYNLKNIKEFKNDVCLDIYNKDNIKIQYEPSNKFEIFNCWGNKNTHGYVIAINFNGKSKIHEENIWNNIKKVQDYIKQILPSNISIIDFFKKYSDIKSLYCYFPDEKTKIFNENGDELESIFYDKLINRNTFTCLLVLDLVLYIRYNKYKNSYVVELKYIVKYLAYIGMYKQNPKPLS